MKDVYVSDNVEQGRNISKYMYIYIYVSICNLHVWIYESKEETSRDACYEKRK